MHRPGDEIDVVTNDKLNMFNFDEPVKETIQQIILVRHFYRSITSFRGSRINCRVITI